VTGADIAASMMRAGAIPNAAFAAAARQTGEKFHEIAAECARRSAARRTAKKTAAVCDVPIWRQIGNGMTRSRRMATENM
jgi:hypothetical protein